MASETNIIDTINCNNKDYKICDAEARERLDDIGTLGSMAYEDADSYPTNGVLRSAISELQQTFQAGVEAIGDACTRKGSTPASSSLEDTVAAIDAITTGGNYGTLEIDGTNGTYDPADEGLDAYNLVIVDKDFDQPHTVVFYGIDGETIIKTQTNVPYHGYASCTVLDGTTYQGQYFKGWNPAPTNIIRDTFCYPIYEDYIIESGEIEDNQETICENKGANYPLGSYKPLVINSFPLHTYYGTTLKYYRTYNGELITDDILNITGDSRQGIDAIALEMVKVAEGEDGSTSTQLSSGCFNFSSLETGQYNSGMQLTVRDRIVGSTPQNVGNQSSVFTDWGSCLLREYLQNEFLSNFPEVIQDTIKTVNKYYTSISKQPIVYDCIPGEGSGISIVEKSSLDKIQIPSYKEFSTFLNGVGQDAATVYKESKGIDYTSIYTPNYLGSIRNDKFLLRSTCARYANSLMMPYLSAVYYNSGNIQAIGRAIDTFSAPFGFCL